MLRKPQLFDTRTCMTSLLNWQNFLNLAKLPDATACLQAGNPQHALVRVTGKDAENFLHAQFSNSVMNLQAGEVRFAAWCNAKGRVWTLLRYWKDGDAIILRMPADQLETTVTRMRMFVLRSDVQLQPVKWHAVQYLGPDAETQSARVAENIGNEYFRIPLPGDWPIYEIWSPEPVPGDLPELPLKLLALPRVLAGLPEVFAAQREEWIPQMLNLDKLDGIDFRKGCYPGQEIVAKLHYKGGLKQRLFKVCTLKAANAPDSGADIVNLTGTKIGKILESVATSDECRATAILRIEDAQTQLKVEGQDLLLVAK